MRRCLTAFVVLSLLAISPVALLAQVTKNPNQSVDQHAAAPATKDEVEALRSEVAAQQETIEELKTMVQRLAGQQASGEPQLVNASRIATTPGVQVSSREGSENLEQPGMDGGWYHGSALWTCGRLVRLCG